MFDLLRASATWGALLGDDRPANQISAANVDEAMMPPESARKATWSLTAHRWGIFAM
jgi:hypothetical protein